MVNMVDKRDVISVHSYFSKTCAVCKTLQWKKGAISQLSSTLLQVLVTSIEQVQRKNYFASGRGSQAR